MPCFSSYLPTEIEKNEIPTRYLLAKNRGITEIKYQSGIIEVRGPQWFYQISRANHLYIKIKETYQHQCISIKAYYALTMRYPYCITELPIPYLASLYSITCLFNQSQSNRSFRTSWKAVPISSLFISQVPRTLSLTIEKFPHFQFCLRSWINVSFV